MKKENNVLFVGGHPDDVELGCGGTLSKHLAVGDNVFVLVMTNGENGNHTPDKKECFTSMKKLGVKNVFFANIPDGYLQDDYATVNLIEEHIKKFKINRVYTHSPIDRHQDHRHCSLAVSSAARRILDIFLFEGPSTNPGFDPHYFIELSESDLKKKLSALSSYKTQIEKGVVNLNYIEQLAGIRGVKGNTTYAEAFALNHMTRRGKDV